MSKTDFPNQPIELNCGNYECNDDGVLKYTSSGKSDPKLTVVFPQPILISEIIYNITTQNERIKLNFLRGNWRHVVVDKVTLANKSKIIELANKGVAVNSNNAATLINFLSTLEIINYRQLPKSKETSKLGWISDKEFIPYCENIKISELEGIETGHYSSYGNFDTWLYTINIARKSHKYFRIMLASAFASPLLKITNSLGFITHIWGGTGMGKSVAIMCAASIFGNPDLSDGIIANFNTTKVGLERLCEFLNNIPLFVDELETNGNRSVDEVIYMITQGKGRTRGNKRGGVDRTAFWRNCGITTGEYPLNDFRGKGGAVNRIIDLKATYGILDNIDDVNDLCNSLRQNYGHAGKIFIDYILTKTKDEIYCIYKDYLKELANLDGTGKQNMAVAMILTADKLANECIFHDDLQLTCEDFSDIILSEKEVSQAERLYSEFFQWFYSNKRHFDETLDDRVDMWGRVDYEYITDSKNKKIIRIRVISSVMNEQFFKDINPSPILSEWKRLEYIDAPSKGNLRTISFNNINAKAIYVNVPNDVFSDLIPVETGDLPY